MDEDRAVERMRAADPAAGPVAAGGVVSVAVTRPPSSRGVGFGTGRADPGRPRTLRTPWAVAPSQFHLVNGVTSSTADEMVTVSTSASPTDADNPV